MEGNSQYNNPVKATLTGITNLFKSKERVGELKESDRLDGKKVLITGSSSGLGLASAKQLASLGAEVIMAVRSGIPEKGEEVKKASGSEKIQMLYVDLLDFNSIKDLVEQVKGKIGPLDVVICNAGIVAGKARKTKDGLEEMFMVNYVSSFYFLRLLLAQNLIKKNDPASRIVIVDSESHRDPKAFNWDDFGKFKEHKIGQTVSLYGYYKLLLVTFAHELSRRLNDEQTTVSVFSLCPGPVNSNIAREAPAIFQPLLKLVFSLFFRSPEKAAEPVLYMSASADLNNKSWDYMFLMERKNVDPKATEQANGVKLWNLSNELITSLGYPIGD